MEEKKDKSKEVKKKPTVKEEKPNKNYNNYSPTGDTALETGLRNAGIIW